MESFWFQYESSLRWGLLLGAFAVFAVWETLCPRRVLAAPTARRWVGHTLLSFLNGTVTTWVFRAAAVVVAAAASSSRYGLLNRQGLPFWARCLLAVLLIDLLRWSQHYAYHAISLLWRVHKVHHSDPDFDWSTGFRFHPLEVLITHGSYLAVIAVAAPPAIAVLGFELAEVVLATFAHANVNFPRWMEAALRAFLITPDMHRIHHSDQFTEQNTNFGVVFSWWDRLFGTYLQDPARGHAQMGVGLPEVSIEQGANVWKMLAMPFTAGSGIPPHAPSENAAECSDRAPASGAI